MTSKETASNSADTGSLVTPNEREWYPDEGPLVPDRVAFWVPKGEDAPNRRVVSAILDTFLDESGDYVEGWQLGEEDWQEWPEVLVHLRALVFCAAPGWVVSSDAVRVILDAHRAGVPVWYLGLWNTLYALSDVTFRILAAGTRERFASVEVVSWLSGSR